MFPKFRNELSGNKVSESRQVASHAEDAGARILDTLRSRDDVPRGREISWLTQQTGLADSTIRDAIKRGPSRADVAVKIGKALGVDLEWMLTGDTASRGTLRAKVTETSDWVDLPRHALSAFQGVTKPEVSGVLPVPKAWLDGTLRMSVGLWATEMPNDALPEVARGGDTIICRDPGIDSPEPADQAVYIFLIDGNPVVRRVSVEPGRIMLGTSDRFSAPLAVDPAEIGGRIALLGRVVGAMSLHKV